jgi:hypothetical protein
MYHLLGEYRQSLAIYAGILNAADETIKTVSISLAILAPGLKPRCE